MIVNYFFIYSILIILIQFSSVSILYLISIKFSLFSIFNKDILTNKLLLYSFKNILHCSLLKSNSINSLSVSLVNILLLNIYFIPSNLNINLLAIGRWK